MSRRALAAHVAGLLRSERNSGMQAELRRYQATIPPEKRGLAAQFEMGATIQACPDTWAGRLALALCLGTILKVLDMALTYLAEDLWTYARQKCEDAGRVLSDKKKQKIDAEIWDYFRKKRSEGEKIRAKTGGTGGADRNR